MCIDHSKHRRESKQIQLLFTQWRHFRHRFLCSWPVYPWKNRRLVLFLLSHEWSHYLSEQEYAGIRIKWLSPYRRCWKWCLKCITLRKFQTISNNQSLCLFWQTLPSRRRNLDSWLFLIHRLLPILLMTWTIEMSSPRSKLVLQLFHWVGKVHLKCHLKCLSSFHLCSQHLWRQYKQEVQLQSINSEHQRICMYLSLWWEQHSMSIQARAIYMQVFQRGRKERQKHMYRFQPFW